MPLLDPNRPKPPIWRIIAYVVAAMAIYALVGYFLQL